MKPLLQSSIWKLLRMSHQKRKDHGTYTDTHLIIMDEKLTDIEINHGQKMLKQQLPRLKGLRSTLQQDKPSSEPTIDWIQIVHCQSCNHWITATTIGCNDGMVKIYDSVFRNIDDPTKQILYKYFPKNAKIKVVGKAQKQVGEKDCGIFSLAFSTSLALGVGIEFPPGLDETSPSQVFPTEQNNFISYERKLVIV